MGNGCVKETDMAVPTSPCMYRDFSRTLLLRERCALGMTSPELVRLNTSLLSARIMWKPLRCTALEAQVCKFLDFGDCLIHNVYGCFEYIAYA